MKNLTLLIKPAAGLCNMNCKYCFYRGGSQTRDNKIMSKAAVDTLVQRIRESQPASVNILFQGGEPTLAGIDFFRYFTSSVRENIHAPVSYGLQSNGLLIDRDYAKFFKENNFLLGISLDGNRKTNDRYRISKNGNGVLPEVLNGIAMLKKFGVEFNILSVIDDENAADIQTTWDYFKKHDFRYLQFIPYVDEVSGVTLSIQAYADFLKRSFDLWYEEWIHGHYISVRHIDNYIQELRGQQPENCAMCGICGSYFVVEANGDLFPCDFYCRQEYRLGSIYEENPFAMSEKQRSFIERSEVIHSYCSSCKYYQLCRGGCCRDRTENFTQNRYCEAYKQFFEHAFKKRVGTNADFSSKRQSFI